MKLQYIGMDSWSRPVYQDENGQLVKDVQPRKDWPPKLCKPLDNAFDGEPDVPYHGEEIEFVGGRVTWSW